MSIGARGMSGSGSLYWRARLRGMFGGLAYAVALALALVASWAIQSEANNLPRYGAAEALRHISHTAFQYAVAMLPPLPLLTLTLNLAPRAPLKRAAWLVLPVFAMAMWSSIYMLGPDDPVWRGYFAERLLTAVLLAAVCWYQSAMRGATDTLMGTQIEGATLGAELERARLQMLRSQIEPHFLFNTLANVRTLARIDRSSAVEMLDNLMRYLAAALPKLREGESSLDDEMRLVDAYLRIFRVRMGTRLSYEVSTAPGLDDQRIPAMMLLTLVENALKHGINPAVEGGFIRVSAARSGSSLVLEVADSGQGMTDQPKEGTGSGLANVRLRLLMQYGDSATLTVAHAVPRGLVAAISLPLRPTA
ncbi:MAG TPA: histidine kinase [Steroidobacteraceae bacterium]|jgi:signal transduction histidine kinase|nr:histidine kinase [Steroidobacteraceae bacterium]